MKQANEESSQGGADLTFFLLCVLAPLREVIAVIHDTVREPAKIERGTLHHEVLLHKGGNAI